MEHLKKISNQEIYEIDDRDVLHFLVFKDVHDSGRIMVRKETCPHLGTLSLESCSDQIQYGLRHQAECTREWALWINSEKGLKKWEGKDPIVLWTRWGILHVLIWSENISLLSGNNKGKQECSLGERETWRDLKWID